MTVSATITHLTPYSISSEHYSAVYTVELTTKSDDVDEAGLIHLAEYRKMYGCATLIESAILSRNRVSIKTIDGVRIKAKAKWLAKAPGTPGMRPEETSAVEVLLAKAGLLNKDLT